TLLDKIVLRKGGDSVRIQEQICQALGHIGHMEALPILRNVLLKKGFLSGGCASPVRAAAVWALSALRLAEAFEIIQKAVTDSDPNVSGTAKYVLSRRGKETAAERGRSETLLQVFGEEGLAGLEREMKVPKP
ncbi:MAG TPA: HEAT repeat domain-containing protein, partial [Candidatus Xenobia bacterium]